MESCHNAILHPALFIQWFIMSSLSYHTYLKTYNGPIILISFGHIIIYLATSVNINIQTIFILSWLYIILQFICLCNIAQIIFLSIYSHKYNNLMKVYTSLNPLVCIAKFLCGKVIPMQYCFKIIWTFRFNLKCQDLTYFNIFLYVNIGDITNIWQIASRHSAPIICSFHEHIWALAMY